MLPLNHSGGHNGNTGRCDGYLLFNDGHVLQLSSETDAVRRRLIHGLDDIWWPYDNRVECGIYFLTFVLRLMENPGKNLNQEIDPTGDRTWARCVRSNDVTPRSQR